MALTVKLLKSMGLDEEKIEAIIAAHTETTEGLKAERDAYKADAEKLPEVRQELEQAKAAATGDTTFEQKYIEEHQAFMDYKAEVESERELAKKQAAYRKILADVGLDPKVVESVIGVTKFDDIELEGDSIKDADAVRNAAAEKWDGFVVKTRTEGSEPATPPKTDAATGADPEVSRFIRERHERKYGPTESIKEG